MPRTVVVADRKGVVARRRVVGCPRRRSMGVLGEGGDAVGGEEVVAVAVGGWGGAILWDCCCRSVYSSLLLATPTGRRRELVMM